MKLFYFFKFYILMFCLVAGTAFAQSDMGPNSKIVSGTDNAKPQELANQQSYTSGSKIPMSLLNQLEQARLTGNMSEVERLQEIINSNYSEGLHRVSSETSQNPIPVYPDLNTGGPIQQDWNGTDITIFTGAGQNSNNRSIDMKMGEDGRMYLAVATGETPSRFIRVYQSTNSGLTWTYEGGVSSAGYFTSISMMCDIRSGTNLADSLRCIVYYTLSNTTDNNGAVVGYFSFKPNNSSADYMIATVLVPPAGREFNFATACSDGQYFTTATYHNVVFGEYNNAGDSCKNLRHYQTQDWGGTHSGATLSTTFDEFNLTCALKANNGGDDTVYIASERRFSPTDVEIRVIKTEFTGPSANFTTEFLTSSAELYAKPVINIKQNGQGLTKSMIITCTRDGKAYYHSSDNGGQTWGLDFTLDQRAGPPNTTNYTWVSSDSSSAGGGDFMVLFADNDSLNVRRGVNGTLGATTYRVNSTTVTGTGYPVCAIMRSGGNKYSTSAYYGFGGFGTNVYFDSENLPTSISNTNEIAESYSLAQNYPNPFNPTTNIKFSLPKSGMVKLVVFNSAGKEVATLVNGVQSAGTYNVTLDAKNLASGVYFYQITSGDFIDIKKMMLIK